MTVAAFTTRRAYATAIVIGLFIISAAAAGLLTSCDNHGGRRQSSDGSRQCEPVTGDQAKWIGLVDLGGVPGNVNNMIFGTENEGNRERLIAELHWIVPIGWYVVLTGGFAFVLWSRYKRLSV